MCGLWWVNSKGAVWEAGEGDVKEGRGSMRAVVQMGLTWHWRGTGDHRNPLSITSRA